MNAYNYAHIPLLLGVLVFAAGVKKMPGHALEPATTAGALYVGVGLALFLCGHAWFRRVLRLGGPWLRAAAAAAALATVPLGLFTAAPTQLAATAAALCLAVALGNRVQRRRADAETPGRPVRWNPARVRAADPLAPGADATPAPSPPRTPEPGHWPIGRLSYGRTVGRPPISVATGRHKGNRTRFTGSRAPSNPTSGALWSLTRMD
ncbi:low temperature requirement protein A [Streptomyces sp. HNM0645]|uniref:low temperature requirement protein A n=1 Tax=Streptomyces sp. HNM0645 TaxID=2782343 RepID=UPI0024B824A5|nr:low temperature requirement protein A [Streptomyces sp. HNM0645]MDI9883643.1 low temperature requirement protein A [Streptomyces sp. HNM0645]